jgi:hypothetical protein
MSTVILVNFFIRFLFTLEKGGTGSTRGSIRAASGDRSVFSGYEGFPDGSCRQGGLRRKVDEHGIVVDAVFLFGL